MTWLALDIGGANLKAADWLARWADAGYVDQFLPKLAAELPGIRCIDFRGSGKS